MEPLVLVEYYTTDVGLKINSPFMNSKQTSITKGHKLYTYRPLPWNSSLKYGQKARAKSSNLLSLYDGLRRLHWEQDFSMKVW